MADDGFTKATLGFLASLAANNDREWFEGHKDDYETSVRTPALNFISAMTADLYRISPHFLATPKKVGGSLMRIHRDIRFAKDKLPYKTNVGIQFRHELGKDIHAPGYYVHIEPGGCFVGVGLWHPDADALGKLRDALVGKPDAWVKARDDNAFRKHFALVGDTLANAPRGYAKDHPLVADLKRKDFIALAELDDTDVLAKNFQRRTAERFAAATPYMRFLCQALELQF
jgi:uncharacterized protein (TIGR02453 family)